MRKNLEDFQVARSFRTVAQTQSALSRAQFGSTRYTSMKRGFQTTHGAPEKFVL